MSPTSRKWLRVFFAGPGAVIIAMVVMAGMALWLPRGAAQIDNLVLPLVLVPLIWAALFFHACLDRRLGRVAIVAIGLLLIHGGLVAHKFMNRPPAAGEQAK
ncbi:hypothetical protein SAMN06295912_10521 [Sphingomonas laterariae]|uniref:Uncharacterized protein n=1 Tax=Edaphosphingomonas laterariae TaxID=861865 RepID=A0A239DTU2_9SPHN|nr:hypothetical protein [Sphingomonas laterariae]SNS35328.1 hypothetical protein SAMN06295912_10521 [Sphingomonas laterariae]